MNQATPALFAAFPDASAYAAARPEDLWPHVRTLGLFRNKAKAIVAAARAIVDRARREGAAHPGGPRGPSRRGAQDRRRRPRPPRRRPRLPGGHPRRAPGAPPRLLEGRRPRRGRGGPVGAPAAGAMGQGPPAARLAREAGLPRPQARLRGLRGGAALPEGGGGGCRPGAARYSADWCWAAFFSSPGVSEACSALSFFMRRRMSSRFRLERWSTKTVPSRWSVSCWRAMAEQVLRLDLELLAGVVERPDPDLGEAVHVLGLAGDGEAALGVDGLPLGPDDASDSPGG